MFPVAPRLKAATCRRGSLPRCGGAAAHAAGKHGVLKAVVCFSSWGSHASATAAVALVCVIEI